MACFLLSLFKRLLVLLKPWPASDSAPVTTRLGKGSPGGLLRRFMDADLGVLGLAPRAFSG